MRESLERWLIGACVNDPKHQIQIGSRLHDFDFTRNTYRPGIFDAIGKMLAEGATVDEVSMMEPCRAIGDGAWDELTACTNEYIQKEYHGKIEDKILTLANLSDALYLSDNTRNISDKTREGTMPLNDATNGLRALADAVSKRHNRTQDVAISEVVCQALQAYRTRTNKETGLFGIRSIDKMMGTIRRGELIVVAARTGIGKSAIGIYPALRVARAGRGCAIISTEMSTEQMTMRILANLSGVAFAGVSGDEMISSVQEFELGKAVAEVRQMQSLYLIEDMRTPAQIEALLQRHKDAGNPLGLIVIDYIQQLQPTRQSKSGNRVQELTEIVIAVKNLALKYQCVIIAMAQLNRLASPTTQPELHMLKDCGELEQSADRVMALYKSSADDPVMTKAIVLKNRHGACGETELRFYGSTLRFYEAEVGV